MKTFVLQQGVVSEGQAQQQQLTAPQGPSPPLSQLGAQLQWTVPQGAFQFPLIGTQMPSSSQVPTGFWPMGPIQFGVGTQGFIAPPTALTHPSPGEVWSLSLNKLP